MRPNLEVIGDREAAASPGPWEARAYRVYAAKDSEQIVAAMWRPWGPVTGAGSITADAEFVAHAREDVPALIAEVKRLRVQRDEAQDAARFWHGEADEFRFLNAKALLRLGEL